MGIVFVFTNVDMIRSDGDDLDLIVGIGGLGIILLSILRHGYASYLNQGWCSVSRIFLLMYRSRRPPLAIVVFWFVSLYHS
ncbi:hypothetical protein Ccrd_005934 [Cynara cardunculus var. scolymus]|uniref:Uncharacterized protein n=1 Tax=Cynara cardunculus var. scolymus TaxID=59895 RepID=A0A118JUN8_CYNCS|nr:hypothetical protein Ccrd_005934 [Cynara cardunculus var. scolymus]